MCVCVCVCVCVGACMVCGVSVGVCGVWLWCGVCVLARACVSERVRACVRACV